MIRNNPLSTPELTVIVVVLTGEKSSLRRCLTSLTHQLGVSIPEIIVPCDENSTDFLSISAEFPDVRFLRVEGSKTYAELRAIGVRESRGRIVALTEDHCIPSPDWSAQILQAHEASHAAIGGAVNKEGPDSVLNWAFYLADYLRYARPIPEGPTNHLTDCNVSYKRESLKLIATTWCDEFHENDVHESLLARGCSMWLTPQILVYQQRSLNLRAAVRDRYAFGRLFSSTRAADFSASQRLIYSVLSLSLPVVLLSRIARQVLSKRWCAREFARSLPHLILISTVWATGEFLGYATGRAEQSLTPNSPGAVQQSNQEAVV
jgi:hypothetical protein